MSSVDRLAGAFGASGRCGSTVSGGGCMAGGHTREEGSNGCLGVALGCGM